MLRDAIELLVEHLACAQRRLKAANIRMPKCAKTNLRRPARHGPQFLVTLGVDISPSLRHHPGRVLLSGAGAVCPCAQWEL
jgi:hypothetical protein